MAYLALVWRMAGYSIAATRLSMLALAAAAVVFTYLPGRRTSRRSRCAILAVVFLLLDPLFYTQSMLAQLDMPAMLFTVLGLLLFLDDRHAAAAAACTALVLSKETGAILPLIFIVVLYRDPARSKYAAYYLAPFAALAIWFFALWHTTGHIFGDPGFTHYNIVYSLNPVRASVALLRRILLSLYRRLPLGGLDRDPFRLETSRHLFHSRHGKSPGVSSPRTSCWSACWAARNWNAICCPCCRWSTSRWAQRFECASALAIPRRSGLASGLLAGLFLNPPFPFPYENNLALVDFVDLHRSAAQFLEKAYPGQDHLHRLAAHSGSCAIRLSATSTARCLQPKLPICTFPH